MDWIAEAESRAHAHKAPAVRMSVGVGRDEVTVLRKGQVTVKKFNESKHLADEHSHLGPGVYGTKGGVGEGGVKGMPFARGVARRDAVGPFGERPEAAQEALHDALDDEFYRADGLDYDADELREGVYGRTPAFELYKTERYGKEKAAEYPAQEKLGGTWFEGMGEVVAKQRPVVRYEGMLGRGEEGKGEGRGEEGLEEWEGVGGAGRLDLDVKDALTRPRTTVVTFGDPVSQPRFPHDALNIHGLIDTPVRLDLDPHPSPTKKRTGFYVDMSRGGGRGLGGEGEVDVLGEVEGVEDLRLARRLVEERENAVVRGRELTGKGGGKGAGVDMGRQQGRDVSGGGVGGGAGGGGGGGVEIDVEGNVVDKRHILDLDLTKNDPSYAWVSAGRE